MDPPRNQESRETITWSLPSPSEPAARKLSGSSKPPLRPPSNPGPSTRDPPLGFPSMVSESSEKSILPRCAVPETVEGAEDHTISLSLSRGCSGASAGYGRTLSLFSDCLSLQDSWFRDCLSAVGGCRERVGSVYEGWPLLGSLALFLVVRCCGRCRVRLLLTHLVILSIFFVSSVRHWRFSFLGSKTLYCLAIDGVRSARCDAV